MCEGQFQQRNLFVQLTQFRLFAGIYGLPEDVIAPRTEEVLRTLGLAAERDTLVGALPLEKAPFYASALIPRLAIYSIAPSRTTTGFCGSFR